MNDLMKIEKLFNNVAIFVNIKYGIEEILKIKENY